MILQTKVEISAHETALNPDDKIMILGSCFADNIGRKLQNAGFDVCVNPFGTLYNPISLSRSIARLESGEPFVEDECVEMGAGAGMICSFSHHTSFARPTAEEFLAAANESLAHASAFWKECRKVIITLGTIFCYVHDNEIVTNCLKRPAREFERCEMTLEQVCAVLRSIVSGCPDKQFIFTVSPIRHLADGAHQNQISKSTLMLGVDSLICDEETGYRCFYFPAYEIVMDELRDYRFYAEDMTHPSAQTVNYIWERFLDWCVSDEDRKIVAKREKEWRQSQHRPILDRD